MNRGMPTPGFESIYTNAHFVKKPLTEPTEFCNFIETTGVWYRPIYLGYYYEQSLSPSEALAPIWNNIIAIRTEHWAMDRIPVSGARNHDNPALNYTDNWLGAFQSASNPKTFNHGEMIEVWYIGTQDKMFKWGGEEPQFTNAYCQEMPQHFEPHEQTEYVPIYITLDMDNYTAEEKPIEIAIYLNNDCKGATVIKEGQVELNAYISNMPNDQLKDLEFRFYFPGKGNAVVDKYAIMNNQTGRYEVRKPTIADCSTYMQVKLGNDINIVVPAITALNDNFPNPFNPSTKIQFDLAKSGKTKLEIYNVKGQLVKTLINGKVEAGSHSLDWNGKDNNGNVASSGVYFYRLTTKEKTLTNKMLMLK